MTIIQVRSKIWTWVCNFVVQMEKITTTTHIHTGENLDLFMKGDIQNLITYLILKEKERIRNTV